MRLELMWWERVRTCSAMTDRTRDGGDADLLYNEGRKGCGGRGGVPCSILTEPHVGYLGYEDGFASTTHSGSA